jgi:FtsP/CotA-like multicopper oxidase with cupredoxin domain
MKTSTRVRFVPALLLLAFAAPAFAQHAVYNLRAAPTVMTMPDGREIAMWGFALVSRDLGNGPEAGDNTVTVPGPRLAVPAGMGLIVNIVNDTPAPVSIVIPGQPVPLAAGASAPQVVRDSITGRIVSFVHETPAAVSGAPGGPVAYVWDSIKPGTYLYHSGSHPAVQVQMGLYGAVTKNAADAVGTVPAEAYPGVTFDAEAVLLYSEIDPALHDAVSSGTYGTPAYPSTIEYRPEYYLVNGDAADSSGPVAAAEAGETILIRLLNAGLQEHAPQILGAYLDAVAEDGNLYPHARKYLGLLLSAGKTLDAILSAEEPGVFPIFDRRLFRSNVSSVTTSMLRTILFEAPVEPPAEE